MPRLESRARSLLAARERFLQTGDPAAASGIRPEVLASWQRCLVSGVNPTDPNPPPYEPPTATDGQLIAAAEAVLGPESARLSGSSTSLFLSDQEGRLLRRWSSGSGLNRRLDRVYGFPGFSLDESRVGTNAVGTVFETGRPATVRGGEHYLERYLPFACVGVPIRHPIHRRLIGVLDASCRIEDGNSVLMPWATGLARDIERWLAERSSRHERLLLERFLAVSATPPPRPTICLNDRTIISNPAAARLLGGTDQVMLWEQAAQTVERGQARRHTLLLHGREIEACCVPVEDEDHVIGAVVQLLEPSRNTRAGGVSRPDVQLSGFVATTPGIREAVRAAISARSSALPVLVGGGPGTGKLALLSALHDGREIRTMDAALIPVDGPRSWISALRDALRSPNSSVILRHIECIPDDRAQAICAVLDSARPGTRIAATVTTGRTAAQPHPGVLARCGHVRIDLPPLCERPDDIPALLDALWARVERPTRTWSPEVIQVLARAGWPGNVRQLEAVVRSVIATEPIGPIQLHHLPAELRTSARRKQLSRLDRSEVATISETLRQTCGNKLEAAVLLGVSRSTLYRKLRSYGIDLADKTF